MEAEVSIDGYGDGRRDLEEVARFVRDFEYFVLSVNSDEPNVESSEVKVT